jgi:hypothetical protein
LKKAVDSKYYALFIRLMQMEELLGKWSEHAKQRPPWGGDVCMFIKGETEILQSLLDGGCLQIPGEPFDVRFMLEDRRQMLRKIRDAEQGC